MRYILLLGLVAACLPVLSAEPTIPNRPPKPDEWGYRPADRSTVRFNPPSLTWLHEKDAAAGMRGQ